MKCLGALTHRLRNLEWGRAQGGLARQRRRAVGRIPDVRRCYGRASRADEGRVVVRQRRGRASEPGRRESELGFRFDARRSTRRLEFVVGPPPRRRRLRGGADALLHQPLSFPDPPEHLQRRERPIHRLRSSDPFRFHAHSVPQYCLLGWLSQSGDPACFDRTRTGERHRAVAGQRCDARSGRRTTALGARQRQLGRHDRRQLRRHPRQLVRLRRAPLRRQERLGGDGARRFTPIHDLGRAPGARGAA